MSTSSGAVHNAAVALRDAADAVIALGRAASALSEALTSVANLETRVELLEREIVLLGAAEARNSIARVDSRATMRAEMPSHVDTNTAAGLLGRTPQTLRKWACYEDGPLRPVRINGRLAWVVADIRRLLSNDKS